MAVVRLVVVVRRRGLGLLVGGLLLVLGWTPGDRVVGVCREAGVGAVVRGSLAKRVARVRGWTPRSHQEGRVHGVGYGGGVRGSQEVAEG